MNTFSATALAPARRSLSIAEATARASELKGLPVSAQSVRTWAKAYGIGRRVVGRWVIDAEKLDQLLTSQTAA